MPMRNKKRNKPYKPRLIKNPGCYYTTEMKAGMCSIITNIGLVIEISLPQGRATEDHMRQIEDLFNWASMLIFARRWKGFQEEVEEFQERLYAAMFALSEIIKRKRDGKTNGFIARPDELEKIRSVSTDVIDVLKASLEKAPNKTTKEFLAAVQLANDFREKGKSSGQVIEIPETARAILNQRTFRWNNSSTT